MTKHEQQETLKQLIVDRIASDPVERGGMKWAAFDQEELAKTLQISSRTIRTWTDKHPFQREPAQVNGLLQSLFRILGENEEPSVTPESLANIMRKIWLDKTKWKISSKQHGCLIGLAKDWPAGHQINIFKFLLNNWEEFVKATRHYADCMILVIDPDLDLAQFVGADGKPIIRKVNFKSIMHMRIYAEVAPPFYVMHLMLEGKIKSNDIPANLLKPYAEAVWI